jgi:trans-2,3-dihydro-3-hydroxyanthranilate isomerase
MLRFDIVDVFTDHPFAGNQLAVVHGAVDLSDAQLLAVCREFNFSETTFPQPQSSSTYLVRIFTPGGEIPFAGHPTLGTAWVLRESGALAAESVTQSCGVGDVHVSFDGPLVSLTARPRDLARCPDSVVGLVLEDLGLGWADLAGEAWVAGTGLTFVHVPVADDAVGRARLGTRPLSSYDDLRDLGVVDPLDGVNLYAGVEEVHARVLFPGDPIGEDPATGSAATGLGLALVASGALPEGGRYRIRQGLELGRPSTLHGSVEVTDGQVASASVAGQVLPVATGEIAVP